MVSSSANFLLVDGHAHLHHGVPLDVFLSAAQNHFRRAVAQSIPPGALRAVLCLADFPGSEGFSRFASAAAGNCCGDWRPMATEESESVGMQAPGGDLLWLIAGQQTVTSEKLEVMALGTTQRVPGGQPLLETVQRVCDMGALPVLPWGVGKWWGQRGQVIRSAIDHFGSAVALGDNGGRPWCWRPKLFALARKRNVSVIPGGDPLRLEKDQLRNGAFGVTLSEFVDEARPAMWVRQHLAALPSGAENFGHPLGVFSFLERQVALRCKR